MSDRSLDLIRDANPYPEPLPPLPIETVRQRLAGEQPNRRRRLRRPALNAGGVMIACSTAVALVIAAGAIVAFRHSASVPAAGSDPIRTSRQQLLQTLAILRRPQNPSDRRAMRVSGAGGELPGNFRLPRAACEGRNGDVLPCTLKLDTSLVRAAALGGGYRAAVFPTKIERSNAQAARGEGVITALRGRGLYVIFSGPTPATARAIREHGLLISAYAAPGIDRGAILVPDGVSQVRLDDFRLLAPRARRLVQIQPVSGRVQNNFALLQFAGLTLSNLGLDPKSLEPYATQQIGHGCRITFVVYSLPATAEMAWRSPQHRTHRTTIRLRLDIGVHDPPPGSTGPMGPGQNAACSIAR